MEENKTKDTKNNKTTISGKKRHRIAVLLRAMITRIDQNEKRIKDQKMLSIVAMGSMAIILVAFMVFSGIFLKEEKSEFRETRMQLRKDVDQKMKELSEKVEETFKSAMEGAEVTEPEINEAEVSQPRVTEPKVIQPEVSKPLVVLMSKEGEILNGQVLHAERRRRRIEFRIVLKNIGKARSDPLLMKVYTQKPMEMESESTDEKDFDFEKVIWPEQIANSSVILPPGVSMMFPVEISLERYFRPRNEEYPILMKVYYGGEKPSEGKFQLKFD